MSLKLHGNQIIYAMTELKTKVFSVFKFFFIRNKVVNVSVLKHTKVVFHRDVYERYDCLS